MTQGLQMLELDADASRLSMEELQELCKEGRAEGFHVTNYPKGHSPTDFERWWEEEEGGRRKELLGTHLVAQVQQHGALRGGVPEQLRALRHHE